MNLLPFAAATPPNQTIPSGGTTSIALSSNVPGTTFSWTVEANGVSGASNGNGSLITQTLSTITSASGYVIYTITPQSSEGCLGSPLIVVVFVGSSSSNIYPPTHVKGFQEHTQCCKVNVIKWKPPKNGETPVSYRIYRNANLTDLAAVIPANQKLKFKDDCYQSHYTDTYYLVSVDINGNQSVPVVISKCHSS